MDQRFLSLLGKIAYLFRLTGLHRVLDAIVNGVDYIFIKIDRPPIRVKMDGFEIYGYLRHTRFLRIIATEGYEAFSAELCKRHLKPGVVVIDGGAHIGIYSLFVSRLIGRAGKVYAFEPDPYNFRALAYNVKRNKCQNIVLYQQALSNTTGKIYFYPSKRSTVSGSLFSRKDIEKCHQVAIDSTTLDNELNGANIDNLFLKLDLEGAEPIALEGMINILDKTRSVTIILEINPSALASAGFHPNDILNRLHVLGFQVHGIDERNKCLTPVTNDVTLQKGNLYCRKLDLECATDSSYSSNGSGRKLHGSLN